MKLMVDADACSGHGRCYTLAPEVFQPDEAGFNAQRGTTVEVAPASEAAALDAVRNCPERAISQA